MFGAGVAVGAALSTRPDALGQALVAGGGLRHAGRHGVGLWWPALAGFALSSILLGLLFTAITFYGLQGSAAPVAGVGRQFCQA